MEEKPLLCLRDSFVAMLFAMTVSNQALAIESSNEGDQAKKSLGCQVASQLSTGQKTPGQLTTEQSLSHDYFKSYYPDDYQNCIRHEVSARPTSTSLTPYPYEGTVSHIADADIVALTTGQKITLLGIRILEGKKQAAIDYLKKTTQGHTVRITYDQEKKDRFGRLQGYLFLGDEFVNRGLIDEGLAEAHIVPPNTLHQYQLTKTKASSLEQAPYEDEYQKEIAKTIGKQFYLMWGSLIAAVIVSFWIRKIMKG